MSEHDEQRADDEEPTGTGTGGIAIGEMTDGAVAVGERAVAEDLGRRVGQRRRR